MQEKSFCDVAFMVFIGAAFTTSVVVGDWWKNLTSPAPSAIQQELIAPQRASR